MLWVLIFWGQNIVWFDRWKSRVAIYYFDFGV